VKTSRPAAGGSRASQTFGMSTVSRGRWIELRRSAIPNRGVLVEAGEPVASSLQSLT
jgi:hypothetical protein